MSFEILMSIFGAFGIGSVVTLLIKNHLDQNNALDERLYNEKREAYLGLLTAMHDAAIQPSDAASKAYALQQTKIQLFGSEKVSEAAQGILDTNEGSREERNRYFEMLIREMRKDLQSQ
ncbi:hypothetical protein [Emcibacter sp.]|uniref:hypothetical protein n=1 Tax=Emcibacter sp. TaxID=1979954 RepID=UPI002AA69507|nr:hypothetical protein [Emcibacter sp.]